MAKSYEDIIDDTLKPRWIQSCEPVEGTDQPLQTVSIDETLGTLSKLVDGVSNRPDQDIYGITKLLALLASDHHYDNGMHHIDDPDVIENAGIQESLGKLDLDFYGIDVPEESPAKVYSTTEELADKIAELFEYINILRKGLGSQIAERLNLKTFLDEDTDYVGFETDPDYFGLTTAVDRSNFKVLSDNAKFRMGGKTIQFRGSNIASDDGACYIPLSDVTNTAITTPEADVIWAELSFEDLTTQYAPYGNVQYGASGSYQLITPALTATWVDAIGTDDHNIALITDDSDTTLPSVIQLQYKLMTSTYNPSLSMYGVDVITTSTGVGCSRSDSIRGLWDASDDSCFVLPLALISKRNGGIYHRALNPAGTAVIRTGSTTPTSISECFEYTRIGYYNAGNECSDYTTATYDATADTYTLSGTTYYRSGLTTTQVTSHPNDYYADKVYREDIVYVGRKLALDNEQIVNEISEKLLATDLYNRLNPVYSGTITTPVNGLACGGRPMQVIGFGTSETNMFGLDNNGGIFIDKCNNDETGVTDSVRTYWADLKGSNTPSAFRLVEGVHSSETKSYLAYEPSTQTVTINTTSLSGPPIISSTTPVMRWQDGSTVTLSTSWSGLGTSSAYCVIQTSGHSGHTLYGQVYLEYSEGGGLPYVLDDIVQIEDTLGNTYEWCYEKSANSCLGCMWSGSPTLGSSSSFVLPECIDCDSEDELVDGWVYIISSTNIAGQSAQISSYNDSTRTVYLKTSFTASVSASDILTVGKLKPETKRFVIIPYSRGLRGVFTRKRVQATASGYYVNNLPIYSATSGTVYGTVVTGLTASQYLEIIVYEEDPLITGFYITFYHNPQYAIFDTILPSSMTILKPGIFLDTTKGSANEPYDLYRGFVPCYSTKLIDSTKWISASCDNPYFTLTHLEYNRHFDIRPVENLPIVKSGTTLRTNETVLDDYLQLVTEISEDDEDYRLIMGTMLVSTSIGNRLLVALRHVGTFGFTTTTNTFFIDVDMMY